jgi:hypothetical protein
MQVLTNRHPNPCQVEQEEKKNELAPVASKWNGYQVLMLGTATLLAAGSALIFIVSTIYKKIQAKQAINLQEAENALRQQFSEEFLARFKELSRPDYAQVMRKLHLTDVQEVELIKGIIKNYQPTPEQISEIFSGAHVRIRDNGMAYAQWLAFQKKQTRISSHPSETTQYSLQGQVVSEMLFGTVKEVNEFGEELFYSWFQLERHPFNKNPFNVVAHGIDYLKYKITGKNQGPYGSSIYTDKNPIILDPIHDQQVFFSPDNADPLLTDPS